MLCCTVGRETNCQYAFEIGVSIQGFIQALLIWSRCTETQADGMSFRSYYVQKIASTEKYAFLKCHIRGFLKGDNVFTYG